MTLEFLKFKKKINKKNDFKLEFILDGAKSLAIISEDIKSLKIIKEIFKKNIKYSGDVLINKKNIKNIKKYYPFFSEDIGFFNNISLYKIIKIILKINKYEINKEKILYYLEELRLPHRKIIAELSVTEREKFDILISFLISKEILILDLLNNSLAKEDEADLCNFIKKNNSNRNIIIISENINGIAKICDKALVISSNNQIYYDDLKKLEIIKDLIIIKIKNFDEKKLYNDFNYEYTVIDDMLIVRKYDLEKILFYLIKVGLEVVSIDDFNNNIFL